MCIMIITGDCCACEGSCCGASDCTDRVGPPRDISETKAATFCEDSCEGSCSDDASDGVRQMFLPRDISDTKAAMCEEDEVRSDSGFCSNQRNE